MGGAMERQERHIASAAQRSTGTSAALAQAQAAAHPFITVLRPRPGSRGESTDSVTYSRGGQFKRTGEASHVGTDASVR